ncbi:MAG: hypothetical protein A3G93_12385 [Nitrospinae bacterium RIFCSPLOWO2_12_FULL_45_22]|nr:MAG: hypothetical protein A3G93_12385 [Nitrospinae bacterium RIFCSPLOWO2_12_FULL_45_22]
MLCLKLLPLWQGKALLLLCVLRDSVAKRLKSFREKLLSLNFAQTKSLFMEVKDLNLYPGGSIK